jgi:hypothetical protein
LSHLVGEQIPKLYSFHRKVDNGRVLLHEEGVLSEPLYVQDDEPEKKCEELLDTG